MSSGNSLVELQRTQTWPEIRWAFQECQNSHGCFSHLLPRFSAGAGIWSLTPFDNGCVPTMSKTWSMCFRHLRIAAETKRLNFNSPKYFKKDMEKTTTTTEKKSLDLSSGRRKLMNLWFVLLAYPKEWDPLLGFLIQLSVVWSKPISIPGPQYPPLLYEKIRVDNF